MINYQKIDQLKKRLDSYRPLPAEIVNNIHDDLILRWTYNSNAIEGNTLTILETKVVLEGITVGGKSLREHIEAINHRNAIFYIEDLVAQQELLTVSQIRSVHQLILQGIDPKNAGVYRKINVTIAGADHVPPDAIQLDNKMQDFMEWYNTDGQNLHPVERSALVHVNFVGIHPFVDGNGRTSRLLMNLELMKDGYPPVVLPVERRLTYYQTLDQAHVHHDFDPFFELIAECVEESFNPYWHAIGGF